MALVDPSRNPMPYYELAEEHEAEIVAVFETHPHADFVSGHLQIKEETGATIYVNEKVGVSYAFENFNNGKEVKIGKVKFSAFETPGHSPDSITILAEDQEKKALFTGDTLFIGDVGRPDLREKAGNMISKKEELAAMMFESIHSVYTQFPDDALVYPAHGAGSLCGGNMSDATSSILGQEKKYNWAFRTTDKEQFVQKLLNDEIMIPAYFPYNVELNRKGAPKIQQSISKIPRKYFVKEVPEKRLIVDTRDEKEFKQSHLCGSINIMGEKKVHKFETWIGTLIMPDEKFYLVVDKSNQADEILHRLAKIGYEINVDMVLTLQPNLTDQDNLKKINHLDFERCKSHYNLIDIRSTKEYKENPLFEEAMNIPLNELRTKINEIPTDKDIVVFCAGGYRSASGSSIIAKKMAEKNITVYDLGNDIKYFKK